MRVHTNKKRRHPITLIEMIVVMALIAIITSAVAYNYRASLDKGRAFKTEELYSRIRTILELELAQFPEKKNEIIRNWSAAVLQSPLLTSSQRDLKDGWGEPIEVTFSNNPDGPATMTIRSAGYEKYNGSASKASSPSQHPDQG